VRVLAVLAELAERRWSDASVAFYGRKPDFSGDFQRSNLAMRENLGQEFFRRR
jgi:hypothetical protein